MPLLHPERFVSLGIDPPKLRPPHRCLRLHLRRRRHLPRHGRRPALVEATFQHYYRHTNVIQYVHKPTHTHTHTPTRRVHFLHSKEEGAGLRPLRRPRCSESTQRTLRQPRAPSPPTSSHSSTHTAAARHCIIPRNQSAHRGETPLRTAARRRDPRPRRRRRRRPSVEAASAQPSGCHSRPVRRTDSGVLAPPRQCCCSCCSISRLSYCCSRCSGGEERGFGSGRVSYRGVVAAWTGALRLRVEAAPAALSIPTAPAHVPDLRCQQVERRAARRQHRIRHTATRRGVRVGRCCCARERCSACVHGGTSRGESSAVRRHCRR